MSWYDTSYIFGKFLMKKENLLFYEILLENYIFIVSISSVIIESRLVQRYLTTIKMFPQRRVIYLRAILEFALVHGWNQSRTINALNNRDKFQLINSLYHSNSKVKA